MVDRDTGKRAVTADPTRARCARCEPASSISETTRKDVHPQDPRSFLPLRSVELDVLLSVADRPRHGYGILQDADDRTDGHPGFEIPTLYRALRRMHDAGLIEPAEPPENEDEDPRREHWRATTLGREVLRLEIRRLEALVAAGRAVDAGSGGTA